MWAATGGFPGCPPGNISQGLCVIWKTELFFPAFFTELLRQLQLVAENRLSAQGFLINQVTNLEGLRFLERSEVPRVDLPGESYCASQPLLEFNPTGKPVSLLGGGLTTNRPSCLSPIGFHLP